MRALGCRGSPHPELVEGSGAGCQPAFPCGAPSSHRVSSCGTVCCQLPPQQRGTGGSHLIQMRLAEEGVTIISIGDWCSPSWFDRLTMRGMELTRMGMELTRRGTGAYHERDGAQS